MTDTATGASFSPCGQYRYLLWRTFPTWSGQEAPKSVAFILLNPSTADETQNDPTVERCARRAREWGFGKLIVANLFALRSTDPSALRNRDIDPIGPGNDDAIFAAAVQSSMIVCGWGTHGWIGGRGPIVRDRLLYSKFHDRVCVLGITKHGFPAHPLYLPYSARPVPWANSSAGEG